MEGINIFSGEKGLGGALTNPTELAKSKGSIAQRYPLTYHKHQFVDAEQAYQVLKTGDRAYDDEMMANLISQKFLQYPRLMDEVTKRGGVAFLEACSHMTGAHSDGAKAWEGRGRESRFIRNLIAGYEKALAGEVLYNGQPSLF